MVGIVVVSVALVFVFAYLGVGSRRRYVTVSLGAAIAGSLVMLLLTPTPPAYTSELRATRPVGPRMAVIDQTVVKALFAVSGACLLSAAGFHRPSSQD